MFQLNILLSSDFLHTPVLPLPSAKIPLLEKGGMVAFSFVYCTEYLSCVKHLFREKLLSFHQLHGLNGAITIIGPVAFSEEFAG